MLASPSPTLLAMRGKMIVINCLKTPMAVPIIITTLANGLTIFIYSDELHSRIIYVPIIKQYGQKFGSQSSLWLHKSTLTNSLPKINRSILHLFIITYVAIHTQPSFYRFTRYHIHDFDLNPKLQQEIEVPSYICQSLIFGNCLTIDNERLSPIREVG